MTVPIALAWLAFAATLTSPAAASIEEQVHAEDAIVPMESAEEIALRACPGVILARELERAAGGSGLRYSFRIDSGGTIWEVGVDAGTGLVLRNAPDKDSGAKVPR